MADQSALSSSWIAEALRHIIFPLLLAAGYGVGRFIEYLFKRRVENKPETEAIEQYSRLIDLQAKLDGKGMTIADLQKLRATVLGGEADSAIDAASRYTEVAKELVADVGRIEREANFKSGASSVDGDYTEPLTQLEMNVLAAQKANDADRELRTVVVELMQSLSGEAASALQQAQDAWRAFSREEARRAGLAFEGGSIQPLIEQAQLEALTRERIATLRSDIKGSQGEVLPLRRLNTPHNLLEHIRPGVPRKRVEELLGTPTYIHGDQWFYRYVETQVELTFSDSGGLTSVVVALCHGQIYAGYHELIDIPLGKLTLADLLDIDPQTSPRFSWSMRTKEITVWIRIGPGGAWTDYCFGALIVLSGVGHLQDTSFEWDEEADKLLTDPKDVLINWMALPSGIDPPAFNWFIEG